MIGGDGFFECFVECCDCCVCFVRVNCKVNGVFRGSLRNYNYVVVSFFDGFEYSVGCVWYINYVCIFDVDEVYVVDGGDIFDEFVVYVASFKFVDVVFIFGG